MWTSDPSGRLYSETPSNANWTVHSPTSCRHVARQPGMYLEVVGRGTCLLADVGEDKAFQFLFQTAYVVCQMRPFTASVLLIILL